MTQKRALLDFYNYIYENGFPHQWREAMIIPILKPNKPATSPSSYRPIALTNCICKILEKMINWRLQKILENKSYLDPYQSGFRPGYSTTDAHVRLETSAREALMQGQFCAAVFIDITKAFDTIWHYGLLKKIQTLGIRGNLAKFIENFLKNRIIRVKVSSSISDGLPLHAGVPQGSVLSPTLFSVMINDLFSGLDPNVMHSLYADDGAAWVITPSLAEAVETMQHTISVIEEWSHTWGLELSTDKTKAVLFTNKRPRNIPNLYLYNTPIEYVNSYKFLGITFDRHLTWTTHIDILKSRCDKDLRLLTILANRRWGADFISLRNFYLALTRPKVDYGSFLYATACRTNLLKIDNTASALCLTCHAK